MDDHTNGCTVRRPHSAQASNFDYLHCSAVLLLSQASNFDYLISSAVPHSCRASNFDYLISSAGLLLS
ncbi:hypothetical protein [Paenibacillus herberti]|uniref:hypothetical protein n=1 Tax=Paenibacillus herberti TaxID=1619309 RepID=UPI0011324A87|nr:hypothetical protein [Paenibacillus herberti]